MFDIGATELLLIVIVAIIVIGPKDLPLAMRTAGRWIGKLRRVSGHFRSGIDAMIREAELEEMERKWREQNEAIMKEHPAVAEEPDGPAPASAEARLSASSDAPPAAPSGAEMEPASARPPSGKAGGGPEQAEPQLPLPPP